MKPLLNFFFLLSLCSLSAQSIKGVVYDSISALENIKIKNLTTNKVTASNINGEFYIQGKLNDTLKISSIFFYEQKIVIKKIHIKESLVIELKRKTDNLEEVQLISPYKEELRDIEVAQTTLKNQIAADIKNNPHLYRPGGLNPNMDFVAIFGLVTKLFKKKDKYVPKPIIIVEYNDLELLFNTSSLFNDDFLFNNLNIEKDKKQLFFEYVLNQELNSELLDKSKEIELIETFLILSKEFNKILADFKKEQIKKN